MGSLMQDTQQFGRALTGNGTAALQLARKYNPGVAGVLDAAEKARKEANKPLPTLPAAPDVTDATIRDAAMSERTQALKSKGRRSTFLTGEGVAQPRAKTLLGG